MDSRSWLVSLTSRDEKPLTCKLRDTREGQVVEVEGFKAVQPIFFGVMGKDRRRAGVQTRIRHTQKQGAHVVKIRRLQSLLSLPGEQGEVKRIDDDNLGAGVAKPSPEFRQLNGAR